MTRYKPVILESPFAPGTRAILRYLRACIGDCLKKGEAPFASHGLYPGALDDTIPDQRRIGLEAGFAWRGLAAATVVYCDLGISKGMHEGIEHAKTIGHPIEYRWLGGEWTEIGRTSTAPKHEAIE